MDKIEESKADAGQGAPVDQVQPAGTVSGTVMISINAATGELQVSAPPNNLIALAIIEAGKIFITTQMQDAMRRSQASRPPAIVKAGTDALRNLRALAK